MLPQKNKPNKSGLIAIALFIILLAVTIFLSTRFSLSSFPITLFSGIISITGLFFAFLQAFPSARDDLIIIGKYCPALNRNQWLLGLLILLLVSLNIFQATIIIRQNSLGTSPVRHPTPVNKPTVSSITSTPSVTGTPANKPTVSPITSIPSATETPNLPALVKGNENLQSGSLTTIVKVSFPSSVAQGNLIIVAITQWEGTVTGIMDTRGDKYIPVTTAQHANPSNDYVEMYYAKNVIGGTTTITVNFSTAGNTDNPNDENVGIYELSGLDTINPVDQQPVSNIGYTNTPDGGMLHSAIANNLYFVVGVDDDGNNKPPTAGSGYTILDHLDDSNNERFYTEYLIATPGSSGAYFSIDKASHWAVIGVSFKPA